MAKWNAIPNPVLNPEQHSQFTELVLNQELSLTYPESSTQDGEDAMGNVRTTREDRLQDEFLEKLVNGTFADADLDKAWKVAEHNSIHRPSPPTTYSTRQFHNLDIVRILTGFDDNIEQEYANMTEDELHGEPMDHDFIQRRELSDAEYLTDPSTKPRDPEEGVIRDSALAFELGELPDEELLAKALASEMESKHAKFLAVCVEKNLDPNAIGIKLRTWVENGREKAAAEAAREYTARYNRPPTSDGAVKYIRFRMYEKGQERFQVVSDHIREATKKLQDETKVPGLGLWFSQRIWAAYKEEGVRYNAAKEAQRRS